MLPFISKVNPRMIDAETLAWVKVRLVWAGTAEESCSAVVFSSAADTAISPSLSLIGEVKDRLKSLQRQVYSRLLGKTQPTGDKAEDEGAAILEVR